MEDKKQKKNKNKGRKTLAFIMLGIVAMFMASGALVNYLSNDVETDVEVESPIDLKVANSSSSWTESISLDAYGGDTVDFSLKEENMGSSIINSTLKIIVEEDNVVNVCSEITEFKFKNKDANIFNNVSCDDTINDNLVFTVDSVAPAGETNQYDVKTTFADNAKGNYSATVQHVIA